MPLHEFSDLTLVGSLAGIITAVAASAGTFFKLGARNWERLYKAKDKKLQDIKRDPISHAEKCIAASRTTFQNTIKSLETGLADVKKQLAQRLAEIDEILESQTTEKILLLH